MGENIIDIAGKSVFGLLVDEVSLPYSAPAHPTGSPPILRVSDCLDRFMVH
jgi:hypothetical protein